MTTYTKARAVTEGQSILIDGREWPVTAVEFLGPIVRVRSGRRVFRFQGHKTVEVIG